MEGAVLASCVRVFRGRSHWGGVKVSGRPWLEPGVGGPGDGVRRDVKSSGIGSGRSLFQVRGLPEGEGVRWGLPSCPVASPGH